MDVAHLVVSHGVAAVTGHAIGAAVFLDVALDQSATVGWVVRTYEP